MRTAALSTLLALAPILAACSSAEGASCPGEPVASLSFSATAVPSGDPALDGLDPAPALPDCDAALGFPADLELRGTLARATAGGGGALCRPSGRILFGSQVGDRWQVEDESTGAVLDGCNATCGASSRTVIAGDVLREDGEPTGFRGALVEVLTPDDPACGTCVLPCAARYALTGTVEEEGG